MLTGEIPFPNLDFYKLPGKFAYIVRKCVNSDPQKRYQTVAELVADLQSPPFATDSARSQLESLLEGQDISPENVDVLIRLLIENTDDDWVLKECLPNLPADIVAVLVETHQSDMIAVVEAYDRAIEGPLNFEYCDVVARFYRNVFCAASDLDLKALILHRLAILGPSHNRWFVGEVFADLAHWFQVRIRARKSRRW